ncbi:MAG: hypothetical protein ACD_7C00399G0002 [uncultured bacterium]|nr:MAG: hypothetical protein ACD_7C00399G0002 [uncultured bacterium]
MPGIYQNYLKNPYSQCCSALYQLREDIKIRCSLVSAIIYHENINLLYAIYYQIQFCLNANRYNLNPQNIPYAAKGSKTAKVLLLIPGQGASVAQYGFLTKKLKDISDIHLFSAKDSYIKNDPIPTRDLQDRMEKIAKLFLDKNYESVEFSLIGHSLGGIRAFQLALDPFLKDPRIKLVHLITLASRLSYTKPRQIYDDLMCKDQQKKINANLFRFVQQRYEKNGSVTKVHTLSAGKNDWLLDPEDSYIPIEVRRIDEKCLTFPQTCHLSILFSSQAVNATVDIIRKWKQQI